MVLRCTVAVRETVPSAEMLFFCTEVGAMFLLLTATLFLCKQDTKQQLDGIPIVIHKGGGNPELSARFGIADIPTLIFFKN